VNCIILFICANALHHWQFRELLQLSEMSVEDIPYHTVVRWLSQGEMSLSSAVAQGSSRILFHKSKECPLINKDFLTSLGFLVDFLTHVNNLNQCLQGKAITFVSCTKQYRMSMTIVIFSKVMTALIDNIEIQVDDMPVVLFSSVFDAVLQDFADRFQDFERISATLRLAAFPHLVETESAPLHPQMELLELKKFKDEENLLVDTWKSAVQYPLLQELARKTHSFWKHLCVRSSVFKNEVPEEQVPNLIVRQQSGV